MGGKPSGVVQHGHRLAQVSQHVLRLKVVRHDVILQNQPSEVIKSNKQGCGSGSACNFSPGWKTEKRNESQQTLLGYGIFLPSLKLNGSFVNLDPDPPGEKQLDPDLQKINAELQPLVSAMACAGSFSFFGGG